MKKIQSYWVWPIEVQFLVVTNTQLKFTFDSLDCDDCYNNRPNLYMLSDSNLREYNEDS